MVFLAEVLEVMEANILLARFLDQRHIHVLPEEKILVLSKHTRESSVELWWDFSISQNSDISWQTSIYFLAVISIRQMPYIQAAYISQRRNSLICAAASSVNSRFDTILLSVYKATSFEGVEQLLLNGVVSVDLNNQSIVIFANVRKFEGDPCFFDL